MSRWTFLCRLHITAKPSWVSALAYRDSWKMNLWPSFRSEMKAFPNWQKAERKMKNNLSTMTDGQIEDFMNSIIDSVVSILSSHQVSYLFARRRSTKTQILNIHTFTYKRCLGGNMYLNIKCSPWPSLHAFKVPDKTGNPETEKHFFLCIAKVIQSHHRNNIQLFCLL